MKLKHYLQLAGFVLVCEFAGIIGSVSTSSKIPTWYAGLIKPALNPPSWVFGPVWTTLYALMGVAAFLVWRRGMKTPGVQGALGIFAAQLVLNSLWSFVFFGMQSPIGALVIIAAMWATIALTISRFKPLSSVAAWLLAPYLAWVSFAMYLNFSIWYLN